MIVLFPGHTSLPFASEGNKLCIFLLYDFLVITAKAAPHECVIRTAQP